MTEHSADLLNRYQCGEDGRTAYRRWKGKDFQGQVVEFGKKVHHRNNVKGENARNKIRRALARGPLFGHELGRHGLEHPAGVIKASVIRRTGAHRRWDQEGLWVCEASIGTGCQLRGTNTLRSSLNQYLKLNVAQFHRPRTIGDYRESSCCARSTSSSMDSQRNVLDVAFFCAKRLKGVMGAIPKSDERRMEEVLEETPEGSADLKRARDRSEAERTRQEERILQEQEEQEHLAKKMRSHHQDGHEGTSGQGGGQQWLETQRTRGSAEHT